MDTAAVIIITLLTLLALSFIFQTETFQTIKYNTTEYFTITNFKAPMSLTSVSNGTGGKLKSKKEDVTEVIKKLKSISHHDKRGFHTVHIPETEYDHPENHIHLEKGNLLSFPEYFNAWDKWEGCLPDALYQGNCGSCWAFASVTALSARFYIESCGDRGCFEYPQLNRRALDHTLANIDDVYKFNKTNLSDLFAILGKYSNGSITLPDWLKVIKDMHKIALTDDFKRYEALQLLIYVLDFHSLGSVHFTKEKPNLDVLIKRGRKTFKYWSKDDLIDIKELEESLFKQPLPLSAEKLISCCYPACYKSDPSESKKSEDTLANNPQCSGGTLVDAWKVLRDTGTTTSLCIGYSLDNWTAGQKTKNCKERLGPNYSYCSGYNIIDDSIDLEELANKAEHKGIEPITINGPDLMNSNWTNPQLFRFKARNAYKVNPSMQTIQREIIERGPVTTGYHVYPDFQYQYGSKGVGGQKFSGKDKDVVGNTKESLIYMHIPDGTEPLSGHAITIVGWGNYKQIPYWICLNSWGREWGTSGYTNSDNRDGLPKYMDGGGYFWFVRGINNCEFEDNVVAGQPNLGNITYPGTTGKYGWGLPYPDLHEVELIPSLDPDIMVDDNDVKIKTYQAVDGGGTYIFKNEDTSWSIKSMKTPSPYTFFWPDTRPKFILGHLSSDLNKSRNSQRLYVTPETVSNLNKLGSNTPIVVIGNEQLQLDPGITATKSSFLGNTKTPIKTPNTKKGTNLITAYRATDHTELQYHKEGTPIYIFPFRELGISDLEFLKQVNNI